MKPDVADLCALAGLLLVAVGAYAVWPPLGALIPGSVLLTLAALGLARRR